MDKLMTVRYKHTKNNKIKNQIILRNDKCKQDQFQIRFVYVTFCGIIYIAKSLHRKIKRKQEDDKSDSMNYSFGKMRSLGQRFASTQIHF